MKNHPTFRPYLTEQEILYLLSLTASQIHNPTALGVHKKLKALTYKISENLVTPAYTHARNSESLEEKLGFSTLSEISPQGKDTLEKIKQELYTLWSNPETRTKLTIPELELVSEFRYTNDLMTPEEEAEYEQTLL